MAECIEYPDPIRDWARRERIEILSIRRIWIFKKAYRLTVRDSKGQVRSAHLRIGGWWFGWSDQIYVDWDD